MTLFRTLFFVLLSLNLYGQISGTKTVCVSGCDYTSLTGSGGAFSILSPPGLGINGNLILEIKSNLIEDGSVALEDYNDNGSPYTITIRPDGPTMYTLSGDNSGDGLISILGGDRVIIDGRNPGNVTASYSNRYLTIQNTNPSAPTINISGDAISCSIRSVIIEGGNSLVTSGVVTIGGGTTSGNDDLTIDYCDIKDLAGDLPVNGVYLGGGPTNNDNISISNNRIFNFYPININGGCGICIANYNSGTVIEGNSIYQTADRSLGGVAGYPYSGIKINSRFGNGLRVLDNFIGGTQENCGGTTPLLSSPTTGSVNAKLINIEDVGFTTATEVSGNTIKNIATVNAASTGLAQGCLIGISVKRGAIDVLNNSIGDATGGLTATFDASTFASSGLVAGIFYQTNPTGTGITGSIENNQIDNLVVDASGTTASGATEVAGIYVDQQTGTSPILIKKNVIGNLTGPVRLTTNTNANTILNTIGINIYRATTAITIDRNKIANLSSQGQASESYARGISATAAANLSISRNTIFNISSSSNSLSTTESVSGIFVSNTLLPSLSISNNTIYQLSNPNLVTIAGVIVGAVNAGVNPRIENNMITLGYGLTNKAKFYGVYNNTTINGTLQVYANSVAITGSALGSVDTNNTFAFYRESSSPSDIRSNLFFNDRQGGQDNFAIGTSVLTGWSSDYNSIFSIEAQNAGFLGSTKYNFADWQAVTTGDAHSKNEDVSSKFISLSSGNLRIPDDGTALVNNNIIDKGSASIALNSVNEDIDEAHRMGLTDIGASEVLLTWTGAVDSDWNNAGNWTGGIIPSCGGRELIKIGPVVDNELNITGPAEFREFVILEGATVTMSGAGSITQCAGSASPYSLVVNGTLTVSGSQSINLYGDFNQNGTFNPGTGTLSLLNSSTQIIDGDDNLIQLNNLTIDGGGGKTLNQPVSLSGTLALTSGLLNTSTNNIMTLGTAAMYTGGSVASYINGPIAKETTSTSEFFFPIGKDGKYRTASIQPTSASATTFTAEYFNVSAIDTYSDIGTLETVSDVEHWIISRSGPASGKVKLTWDEVSGVSANAADRAMLRVVRWDGQWTNAGGPIVVGDQTSGYVQSNNVPAFSPFTLGSESDNNPLPVELLNFTAHAYGNQVKILWETVWEDNNDYFIVESSQDGETFKMVTKVGGKGTSSNHEYYTAWDPQPYKGTSYYRLKQVDFDGNVTYSKIIEVNVTSEIQTSVVGYPNPVKDDKFAIALNSFKANAPVMITIMDVTGTLQQQRVVNTNDDGFAEWEVLNTMTSGLYMIKAFNETQSYTFKIVIAK